jgi:hypothetical protein
MPGMQAHSNMKGKSKKSFQANEAEANWRGFLVDADAVAALDFLERAVRATAHDDRDIVAEARNESRTIVTSNRRHFLRYIQEYQSRANNEACRDLWGLAVIPNPQLDREKGLDAIRRGLGMSGKGTLRWPAVGFLNLYVRLTSEGEVEVRRFTRCPFCAHPERGMTIKKPWDAWYSSLSVVAGR